MSSFFAARKSTYHFHQDRHGFARFIGWGFIAFGGFFLITMIVEVERLKTTQYALTDQRVLVVSGNPIRHVDSVFLSNLDEVGLETYFDGTGTIRFGADSYYKQQSRTYVNGDWQTEERKVWILALRLERIPEVAKLHELILKARRNALAQRSSGAPPQLVVIAYERDRTENRFSLLPIALSRPNFSLGLLQFIDQKCQTAL